MTFFIDKFKKIYDSLLLLNGKKYILIGILNTIFGYFSSVYLYVVFELIFIDYIIFIIAGILGIIFSYFTMSILVFERQLNELNFKSFLNYLTSSIINLMFSVLLSTILIRLGLNIYLTQLIAAVFFITVQLILNLFFLSKR